jgi:hypothetical protein
MSARSATSEGEAAGSTMPAAAGSPVGGGKLLARGIDTFLKELGAPAKRRLLRPQKQAMLVREGQPAFAVDSPYAQTLFNDR